MSTHLVIPDPHATPGVDNSRADYLSELINDIRPDVVINLGDMFDMPSLSSYDKGTKSFQGRTYRKDIDAGLEFDDRIWHKLRKNKRRLPRRVFCEGNHEFRAKRAVEMSPELEGTISFKDFDLNHNYDDVVEYRGSTPGVIEVDGVHYAHFLISGVKGLPISGVHTAYNLVQKQGASCTVGHLHTTDYYVSGDISGRFRHGLVSGVYQEHESQYAGGANDLWWRGVIVKRNVSDGTYDPQWISLDSLKKEYGK